MDYETTLPFAGDFNKAADVVKNTMLPHGFQVINNYKDSIELEGTNSFVNKGADPITGISWLHIQKSNNSLIIQAEFGAIKKTIKIMRIITILGTLVSIAVLTTVFIKQQASAENYLLFLIFIPSFIIPIFIAKSQKSGAIKSLNTLLNNMITLGK